MCSAAESAAKNIDDSAHRISRRIDDVDVAVAVNVAAIRVEIVADDIIVRQHAEGRVIVLWPEDVAVGIGSYRGAAGQSLPRDAGPVSDLRALNIIAVVLLGRRR